MCPRDDTEGRGVNEQPPDGDDLFCFPAHRRRSSTRCPAAPSPTTGFDGASYQRLWPDGNTKQHPTPFQFTSPLTGPGYNKQYSQVGFETDLPAIESTCNATTGAGCTLIPQTDEGKPGGVLSLLHHDQGRR